MCNKAIHNYFSVTKEEKNQRLDQFLSDKTGISRNQIQIFIKNEDVLCNEKETKPSYLIQEDDKIFLRPTENSQKDYKIFYDKSIDLELIFEDDDVIVVNKPAGLVTHPGAGLEEKSVVHALFDKLPQNSSRPGVVHRLDKDTQGLMVLAKNIKSHKTLSKQFKDKVVQRVYRTLCYGKFKEASGKYESFLSRDPKNRKKYKSQDDGRLALTHFNVISENEISFVELKLETGRTHQIRVHLSENHHPILNDTIYGHSKRIKEINDIDLKKFIKNLKLMPLVAIKLKFNHPKTNQIMNFSIPWPKEFVYENLSD